MSTKKPSLNFLQNKIEEETLKNLEILKSRIEMVANKIETNKNQTCSMERDLERIEKIEKNTWTQQKARYVKKYKISSL